jgi:hypothetical protein
VQHRIQPKFKYTVVFKEALLFFGRGENILTLKDGLRRLWGCLKRSLASAIPLSTCAGLRPEQLKTPSEAVSKDIRRLRRQNKIMNEGHFG